MIKEPVGAGEELDEVFFDDIFFRDKLPKLRTVGLLNLLKKRSKTFACAQKTQTSEE